MSSSPPSWRSPVAASVAALLITACSSLARPDGPSCSGARRPANPHGSVLAPEAGATPDTPTTGAGQCRSGRR